MPPKEKSKASGSTEKKSAPKPAAAKPVEEEVAATKDGRTSKPDQPTYQAEQDSLKKEIDEVTAKLNAVKERINGTKGGSGNKRRDELKAELDEIRGQQASNKSSRARILEQMQNLKARIDDKIKTLSGKKSKAPYKSSQDIDNQITKLTKQVETGSMKLVDEKKALNEISSLRRVRKTVEDFQAEQDSIDADRKELDELRKQLDDPEVKAASERFDKIKNELDELKKESDVAYGSRNQLYDERKQYQELLDELWSRKKEAQAVYRQESDKYYQQVKEDRAKRAEKQLAQKKAEEVEKKKAHAEQLLEDARHPAFAAEVQDCQTLIDYFSAKTGTAEATTSSSLYTKNEVAGAPKLELRQVDSTGLVLKKKKGEIEENYFVAKKKPPVPKKGAPTPVPAPPKENHPSSNSQQLQLPFGTLSGLLALSIPPPANAGDVPRVVEDLKTKKAWFQANQARVTQENIAKAEAQIAKLEKGKEGQETTAGALEEVEAVPAEVTA